MKKKRTWIIMIVLVALIGGGFYLATRPVDGQALLNQIMANAQTAQVVRTTLSNSVESSGSIIPEAQVQLAFGTSGTVAQVQVAVGDQVKQGEVLAALDSTDLQAKVTQAEQSYMLQQLTYSNTLEADPSQVAVAQASYQSAQASYTAAQRDYNNLAEKQLVQCSQLTTAKNNLDRAQTAYDRLANDHQAQNYLNSDWGPFQGVVNNLTNAREAYALAVANCNITKTNLNDSSLRSARAQLQSAEHNLNDLLSPRTEKQIQAKAQLEQARLSLEQAKRNLAKTQVVAPFDGVITAVNIEAGGASGSDAAIEIADVSRLHVDVLVDETLITQVQPGQKVRLTLDALLDATLSGEVDRIDPAGVVTQGVVNYNVRVVLDRTELPIKLDMTANAAILGETHENVLAVPSTAIRSAAEQGAFGGQGLPGGLGGQGGRRTPGGTDNQGTPAGPGGADNPSGQTERRRMTGSFVIVLKNGQPRLVPVTTGLTTGDLTEVSGELQAGDEVLVGELTLPTGMNGMRPGMMFGGPGGGGPQPGMGQPPF